MIKLKKALGLLLSAALVAVTLLPATKAEAANVVYKWDVYTTKSTSKYALRQVHELSISGSSYGPYTGYADNTLNSSTGQVTYSGGTVTIDKSLNENQSTPAIWLDMSEVEAYGSSQPSKYALSDPYKKYFTGIYKWTPIPNNGLPWYTIIFYESYLQTTYSRDVLIGTETSSNTNQYPSNGRHSDGRWYVKTGTVPSPTLKLNTNSDIHVGAGEIISLVGSVSDVYGDVARISATLGGVTKQEMAFNGDIWTLSWSSNEIPDGSYTNIVISADDLSTPVSTITYNGTLIVSKTQIPGPTNPTNPETPGTYNILTGHNKVNKSPNISLIATIKDTIDIKEIVIDGYASVADSWS